MSYDYAFRGAGRRALGHVFYTGAAVAALMAQPALAQAADASTGEAANEAVDPTAIVVTAQRREESIIDVPVAVSVTSGETLRERNITRNADLIYVTPGLTIQTGGASSRNVGVFAIRGQGGGAGVTSYMSEVPEFSSAFFDLENVQVLKGPQGTLFGRVTTGGAILFTPQKPGDELNGYLNARVGQYGRRDFEGAIGGAIAPGVLAVRVAGQVNRTDGFTRNLFDGRKLDGRDSKYFRAIVDFSPTERLTNQTVGILEYVQDPPWARVIGAVAPTGAVTPLGPGGTLTTGTRQQMAPSVAAAIGLSCPGGVCPTYNDAALASLAAQQARSRYVVSEDATNYRRFDSRKIGVANTTTLEATDGLTIKNIFSYTTSSQRGPTIEAFDGTFVPLLGRTVAAGPRGKTMTEEFQVQAEFGDDFEFTGGVFYERNWTPHVQSSSVASNGGYLGTCTVAATCTASFSRARVGFGTRIDTVNGLSYAYSGAISDLSKSDAHDWALYGQATWEPVPGLSLIAGGRYTWSEREAQLARLSSVDLLSGTIVMPFTTQNLGNLSFAIPLSPKNFPAGLAVQSLSNSYQAFTYTLAAQYKIDENFSVYATTRRGYKPGSFNVRAPFTYDPEQVTDYEVGFKYAGRLGPIRALISADAYYNDYTDIQRTVVLVDPANGQPYLSVANVAEATIKGFDVDATLNYDWLTLTGFFNLTDAKYDRYPNSGQFVSQGIPATADLTQLRLTYTSKYQAGFRPSIDFGRLVGDGPEIVASGNLYYQSSYASSEPNLGPLTNRAILPGYTKLDLRLDWKNMFDTGLSLGAAVTNVTNYNGRISGNALLAGSGFNAEVYNEPRTWYLELNYKF